MSMRHVFFILVLIAMPMSTFGQGVDATITVTDKEYRAFKGIGTNLEHNINNGMRSNAEKVWGEGGVKFRGVRMWLEQKGDSYNFYGSTVRKATETGVTEVWGTGLRTTDGNIGAKTTQLANIAKKFRQNGVQFDGLDVCNKPNTTESGCGRVSPGKLVDAIKMVRSKLDAAGLGDVKVIGPSTVEWAPRRGDHVSKYDFRDGDTMRYFDAIENDPEALDAIAAFSSQTYGTGVTDEMYAYAERNNKDYYQMLGATDPIRARNGDDEGLPAVVSGQFLSDVNHGVNLWMYWIHIFFGGGPEGMRPRVQHLKSLAHTYDVGARFRRAESDVDEDMHFNYGSHDNVIAAAAVNPDDSWGLAAVNLSGISSQHYGTTYGSGEAKTVTFNVPQLAGAGTVPFRIERVEHGVPQSGDDVNMVGGRLTVMIPPKQLVTLRSPANVPVSDSTTDSTDTNTNTSSDSQTDTGTAPCHLITPGTQLPTGFGVPWNVLSTTQELLIRAECSATGVTLELGTENPLQYIYRQGYEWNGSSWQQVAFQGSELLGGAWYAGQASATITKTATELESPSYVVGYLCTWTGSTWKCGCRDSACAQSLWQLQAYRR